MAKEKNGNMLGTNDVINTSSSIFKKSNKTDLQLKNEAYATMVGIAKSKKVKFECKKVYAPLFPDGLITTYQLIPITLYFNGETVELPEAIVKYVEKIIDNKAEKMATRLAKFENPKQDFIGSY